MWRGPKRGVASEDGTGPCWAWRMLLPAIWLAAAAVQGASILETFDSNPATRGWHVFGDTNLFAWNAANQNLSVTWDSSRPNSYFYRAVGTILTRSDDFI